MEPMKEGMVKKGGKNDPPTTPKPKIRPMPQNPDYTPLICEYCGFQCIRKDLPKLKSCPKCGAQISDK